MSFRVPTLVALVSLALCVHVVASHEHAHGEGGCGCASKRGGAPEFIQDPTEVPPATCDGGHPRYIPDPLSVKPADWDEEDGDWQPKLMENPQYSWKPSMVPNPDYVPPQSTPSHSEYWGKLYGEVEEAVPWVTMGILVVSVFSVLPVPINLLRSQLDGQGILGAVKAALLGLAIPLCSCGSLPLAAGLVEYGVPLSSVVAFLTASQSAGIDSAVITYGLLGPTAAIFRLGGALVLSVIAGLSLQSSSANASAKKGSKSSAGHVASSRATGNVVTRLACSLMDTAIEMYPLIVIGLAVSTALIYFVPTLTSPFDLPNTYPWLGDVLLRFGIISSSMPLQLCEHSTAAIAAGIQRAGAGAGLAFAFLLSAPATNLPSLLLLAKNSSSYNRLTPLKVASAISLTALIVSYGVDWAGVDLLADNESAAGGMDILPPWFIDASPYISAVLATGGLLRLVYRKVAGKDDCGTDSCTSPACDNDKKVK